MVDFVLGLDLGPNSIGWAMLEARIEDADGHATHELLGFLDTADAGHPPMGVRVFEAGLDNFGTSKEAGRAQQRRTARSMRRNHQRRNARRAELRSALQHVGFLPKQRQALEDVMRLDPYRVRAQGLDRALTPHEFGRAIYHLGQRRGFKSNRKSGQAKEDRGMLAEIGELARAITESGSRTLGEYLYRLGQGDDSPLRRGELRIRNRHTRRDMYVQEFDALVECQRAYHAEALSEDTLAALRKAIFFQHGFEVTEERRRKAPAAANLHRAPSVRPCPLEDGEFCCPRGEWIAQRFRVLMDVNNMRLSERYGPDRKLTQEERSVVMGLLSSSEAVKFDRMRSALAKLGVHPEVRFNLERGSRSKLEGNVVDAKLLKTLSARRWKGLTERERHCLRHALIHEDDDDALVQLLCDLGADREKARKLAGWTPPDRYLAYSKKALEKLLPHLEDGRLGHEAIEETYPDRPEGRAVDKLPVLSSQDLPADLRDITNPVVRRALVEVRKVVNAIVREHGKPRRIMVELAREMKGGPDERKRWAKVARERGGAREEAREAVQALGGNPYSRADVNRYLLWKEQGGVCVYSGDPITQAELMAGGEWDVDHILPRWQSLDDSFANKVLVRRSSNHDKGDRTPAEWLGVDGQGFRHLVQRAEEMVAKHGMAYGKLSRLRQEHVEADGFAQRQLNDTRYITKSVVKYLNLLYVPSLRVGERAVQSCRGSLTSELRRQWGLLRLLAPLENYRGEPYLSAEVDADGNPRKSREDHRHHAIDAVVIAASSRSLLKRYQDHWRARDDLQVWDEERREMDTGFLPPWEGLRNDTRRHAQEINISHRVDRKLDGPLHEETFLGQAKEGALVLDGRYVTRKPVESLSAKAIGQIRDKAIANVIKDRLRERGWDGKASKLPKDWSIDPGLRTGNGLPIRKVRIMVPGSSMVHLGHRHAVSGNNHHMVVLKDPASGKRLVQVVSRIEAARRVRREKQPAVQRDREDGLEVEVSFSRKESLLVQAPGTGASTLCVVQNLTGGAEPGSDIGIILRDARDSRVATVAGKSPYRRVRSIGAWAELEPVKVQVDPLGRVLPAGD